MPATRAVIHSPACLSSPAVTKPIAKMSSVTIAPPKSLESPISVPQKTMMGPGPANVADRVLKATALPVVGHLHPEFLKVMDDVKAGVQYAFQV